MRGNRHTTYYIQRMKYIIWKTVNGIYKYMSPKYYIELYKLIVYLITITHYFFASTFFVCSNLNIFIFYLSGHFKSVHFFPLIFLYITIYVTLFTLKRKELIQLIWLVFKLYIFLHGKNVFIKINLKLFIYLTIYFTAKVPNAWWLFNM